MNIDMDQLPDDPKVLRETIRTLVEAVNDSERKIEQLVHQINVLRRGTFGHRSEKLSPDQLLLFAELLKQEVVPEPAPPREPAEDASAKEGHGRGALPPELPRDVIVSDVPADQRVCRECRSELKPIGEEVSEQLDFVPSSLVVRRRVRRKYACPSCQGNVVIAEVPPQPIDKGLPGPGLLAQVVVAKYADHLPLNRQEGIFERHGVKLNRSTLCGWVGVTAELLEPIHCEMEKEVLKSKVIHTDDTKVPVLDPSLEHTRLGRIWPYLGDDEHPYDLFHYTPTRARDGPRKVLGDFKGFLQADAYSGYDNLYADLPIVEVACWAHTRRYFFDCMSSDAANAAVALAYIRQLYEVERRGKDLSPDELKKLRGSASKPILDSFKAWLDRQALILLPKSPIGQAVRYARTHWEALSRYLEDGNLDVDNNAAERALRRVAIGRKNWMFAGSDEGGRRAAILYSIVSTCKRHGIDPFEYIRDILERVSTTPQSRIRELLPDQWKAARAPLQAQTPAAGQSAT